MARVLTFAYPGNIDTLTGGYLYDKRIIEELEQQGWEVNRLSLGDAFPFSDDSRLEAAANKLADVCPESMLVIDGLALGAMGALVQQFARRHQNSGLSAEGRAAHRGFVALVHHPLALESGISPQQAKSLMKSESQALEHASHIIVNSPTTAETLGSMFGITRERISIVLPGTERPANDFMGRDSQTQAPISPDTTTVLLSVGSIIARKGYDVLVNALAQLTALDWELRIVGDPSRDPAICEALDAQIERLGLADRIKRLGALEPAELDKQYADADVFVLASHYEGYGMAYAQALCWGLPVIGTNAGATCETVPAQAGILVNPGDIQALAAAIATLLTDPERRQQMSQSARTKSRELPTWSDSARRFGAILLKTDTQSIAPHPEDKRRR